MTLSITKHDGQKEVFNADKINRSIERATAGLTDPISMVTQIATETRLTLYDGITTEEMDKATINASVQNIKEDIEYDKVAVRLLLKTVYRRVIGEYNHDPAELEKKHGEGFGAHIQKYVSAGLLEERMEKLFQLDTLGAALKIERDELLNYAGLSSLLDRYSMRDENQKRIETPQYFFMRVAMGLSYNEKNPTEAAIKFYNKMSQLLYIAGGSTNLGAGTTRPSLSNCFLLEMHDDMDHIAKSVADVLKISKASGGIGVSITKLRATGSPLKSSNTVSSGPTPFAKIMDTAIRAVQRGGKKLGALCFYMENWHYDFPEFIDWKHNAGDDYLRMRTANTAVFISDEFMKRVESGDDWYMFDPKETPDLNELYGAAFSKRYGEYVEMAKAGKMRMFKKMPATEQWSHILTALQSTSHPWLTWKDPINLRALNNNTGTIHMSNLCTEITLPQDRDNIAVCNLASLNIAAHIEGKQINWVKLEETVRLAIRHLDNLIDINILPIEEAARSDRENRAVGLGVMGFSDALEQLSMSYESPHAWDFADRIFEFISYMAIDESANLARERGSYTHFEGSGWSKGMVPLDTITALEHDRGMMIDLPKITKQKRLDWDQLRAKVKGGMRNATLMAVAPNANIGLVAGTTPGIDPRFAQVFARNKISGKYMDINHNLVKDLKNMGLWEDVKEKIIEAQGDISQVEGLPAYFKEIYKTAFTTNPYAYIEVAARAQKWVDQALSRNMYLESRDMVDMKQVYLAAWKKGLKTTYYLHMKPRHTAEQSTTNVNKSEMTGKRGFGNIKLAAAGIPLDATLSPVEMSSPSPMHVEEAPVPVYVAATPVTPHQGGFAAVAAQVAETPVAAASAPVMAAGDTIILGASTSAPVQSAPAVAPIMAAAPAPVQQPSAPMGFSAVKSEMPVSAPAPIQASAPIESAQSTTIPQADTTKKPFVCPVDPQERLLCDSCQ
ncbi:MAG: nrdA [Candidatus Kaiserbacteria bacterium]|nr:nrdA [Candidatus Kaiserbacteria bacterium]